VTAATYGYIAFPSFTIDDTYIAYRYAYNIFHHGEYVFNLDEKVLATTSPLYTLLLTVSQFISNDLPQMSIFISYLSSAAAGFLAALVIKRDNWPVAVFCALSFPFVLRNIGLETNFLIFLLMLSCYLFATERYMFCSGVMGLAILTRPDSVIFVGSMVVIYWIRRQKLPWKEFPVLLVVIVPWYIFSYFYFGELFPASLEAKSGHAGFVQYFFDQFAYLAAYCDKCTFGILRAMAIETADLLSPRAAYTIYLRRAVLIALYLPVALLGVIYYFRNLYRFHYCGFLFYIYPLLMTAALSFIGPPPTHRWHMTVAVNFAMIGYLNLLTLPFFALIKRYKHRALPVGAVLAGYLCIVFVSHVVDFHNYVARADTTPQFGAKFHSYKNVGLFLREHVPDEESVFALEVGTIGYFSRKRIIDGAGLISPGYDKYHRQGCWLIGIKKEFPEYIVAEQISIPYYTPIFSYENNFGNEVVYEKSGALPEDDYPFAELRQNWNRWYQARVEQTKPSPERRAGRFYEWLDSVMSRLLDRYR